MAPLKHLQSIVCVIFKSLYIALNHVQHVLQHKYKGSCTTFIYGTIYGILYNSLLGRIQSFYCSSAIVTHLSLFIVYSLSLFLYFMP